ncbi:MAG TPA: SDR family oxidoreductase [Gemmatimonadales bacterium]|jgi:dehydrogenase/reductase SDR family protein 13|nr:SDR family oxidoreductase [Gemmatimonadales bacterium]
MTADPASGRVMLVTGGTSGIGQAVVEALARRGARTVLAARSESRARAVIAGIRATQASAEVEYLPLDLADLASVRRAAATFLDTGRPLDVLMNNAGVAGTMGLSPDGFDLTYATNHLGPFLLTELLRPALEAAPQGRLVNVSSIGHLKPKAIDWTLLERRPEPRRSGFHDYTVTKLMNVLHAKELARRLERTRVTTYALHPGGVRSNIWRALPRPIQWIVKLSLISNEAGARTPLYCATAPELATTTGRYYDRCREAPCNPLADDPELAAELWRRSEAAVFG